MSPSFLATIGFGLVLAGTVLGMRPAHRGAGFLVGVGTLGCALLLAWTEGGRVLGPETWFLLVAFVLCLFDQMLRIERESMDTEHWEIR